MAFDFASGTDRINYGSPSYLDDMGPLTYAVWIQRDSVTAGNNFPRIISKDEKKFFLLFDATSPDAPASYDFVVAASVTNHDKIAPANSVPIASTTWVHLAATWNGTLTTGGSVLYKNGTAESSYVLNVAGSGSITSDAAGDFAIGNRSSGTFDRGLDGRLAELAVWNVALSADEIASLAKGFKPNRIRPQNLVFVVPLLRSNQDIRNATTGTTTGATGGSDHPRVY